MAWKSGSICGYCNEQIKKPNDAVLMFDLKGEHFFHVRCYADKVVAYAKDGRLVGAAVAASGGSIKSALVGLSVYNKTKDVEESAQLGKRKDMQQTITGNSNMQLGIGVIFSLAFVFLLLNMQRVKLDILGWAAVLILGLVGVAALYVSINYRMKLKEFESILKCSQ